MSTDRILPCTISVPAITVAAILPSYWQTEERNCARLQTSDDDIGRNTGPEELNSPS